MNANVPDLLNILIAILGLPILGFILLVGFRFAWYILSGRYWLDRRTGFYNRG